jgi:hypothetical protein
MLAEVALDAPVFERVERDDGEAAARSEQGESCVEGSLKLAKLVVDADAQGLKGPRGRMHPAVAVAAGLGDSVGEGEGARPGSAGLEGPGDAAGTGLFPQLADGSRELGLVEALDR